ncbi:aspartate decarboxylase [Thermosipho melanesiensis]|uniref:Aspartate 1-decarboxylase n=2 Tax=Thermosipho melanesiensis TaxID=46541 RepID=PAND_THEM4|nr:aspartate 1-decarboxylase [Thermosipho melanesiensis]A6LJQ5.1 RecName: Full=Aspartate 1-decarboxylase; AltName: Full=Aspartate alpha-decarboxylase; Contains: RecName: Full=Aspartate 1-decarboxylase beta chain; Contains: RecName: Full=Aspartate 1-decarboxylase alpha chain; Flags: Precursor [Thermosipho melanesiensis BI429]ABR30156.1 aspartate 1-decarboxylase [Thermosipho melanesiensis BI429]APT73355.1 aspartate decarboxylase [Thermosipho melanesiensis]OOC38170.1 aspartate decarboxylase [Therm
MQEILLKSKIHMAKVTDKSINYMGSIGIDVELLEKSNIKPYELVLVADVNNGQRFVTYTIPEEKGSRKIVVNGAAARLVEQGDRVIIMAFGMYENDEYKGPRVLIMNEDNEVVEIREGT